MTALPSHQRPNPLGEFNPQGLNSYDKRPKIGLLVGNDISALKVVNEVAPKLARTGYRPVIFLAEHRPSKKATAHQLELQDLSFYERYLTNNVIFPITEGAETQKNPDGSPIKGLLYSPDQLAELYDEIQVENVKDINAPEFVQRVSEDTSMPLIVSTRCYQIAHSELISAQEEKNYIAPNGREMEGAIWNMHPAKLPEYQGLFGPLYAMSDLQKNFAWTLHKMIYDPNDPTKGIDQGHIITQTTNPIDYSRPAMTLYTDFAETAAQMLYNRINDHFGNGVPLTPQADFKEGAQASYYTHPNPEFFTDFQRWAGTYARLVELSEQEGFRVDQAIKEKVAKHITAPEITDFAEVIEEWPKLFAAQGTHLHSVIAEAVDKATMDWEQHKVSYHRLNAKLHPEGYGVIDTMLLSGKRLPNGYAGHLTEDPAPQAANLR